MNYKNILVRMPNWLGDIVMATPILFDLKQKWPEASITAMAPSHLAPILYGTPWIDEIFSFSRPNEFERRGRRDIIARLRQGKFDLGVLLTNSFSSAVMLWRASVKERVGFSTDFRRFFLTRTQKPPEFKGREHLVNLYKQVLEPIGIAHSDTSPTLFVTEDERKAALQLLGEYNIPSDHKIIGVNPLAAYGEAKCWPKEKFKEMAKRLTSEEKVVLIFFGDASGSARIKDICEGLSLRVINLSGLTTLRELVALIERCDVFVTNDSGPMHIAAALGRPLVAIFGSTNELATGPYRHGMVLHRHESCSPCYLRKCPIDFRCMQKITVDEVIRAIKSHLQ